MSDLVPLAVDGPVPVLPERAAPLDRLPGDPGTDLFLRLAAGFLAGYPAGSRRVYSGDLRAWAGWCGRLGVHPLAAERIHVDAWVENLSTQPQPATGRPAAPASIARRLSALSAFYDYGIKDAEVLTHSPVGNVRRPRVADESSTVGLTADELRRLLAVAAVHSPRSAALVPLLILNGLRISEALGADIRHYTHDRGHRVLRITRKGAKPARVPLAPPVVRALEVYLCDRASGPIFTAADGHTRYPYKSAYDQLRRLASTAGIDAAERITPHSLRHSFATEALTLGAPLQDVQDALGHADPRTTRRYDRSRQDLDRSPTYLLATTLVSEGNLFR